MGAAAGAAAGAVVKAIKASGAIVRIEPPEFYKILARAKEPLVVVSEAWMFGTSYRYLLAYKGLTFFTKSRTPLELPADVELVNAGSIWVPSS